MAELVYQVPVENFRREKALNLESWCGKRKQTVILVHRWRSQEIRLASVFGYDWEKNEQASRFEQNSGIKCPCAGAIKGSK